MHDDSDDGCDWLISCEPSFGDFEVDIYDRNNKGKEFPFSPDFVGKIFAKCISPNTDEFVKTISGENEPSHILQEKEVYFGYTGFDETIISAIENGDYGDGENVFFFRLKEQSDGKWVLSFVFYGNEEVQSIPVEWTEFSK